MVVARSIHWNLPSSVHNAIGNPFARDRIAVLEGLVHDDSKAVSTAAMKLLTALNHEIAQREAEKQARRSPRPSRSMLVRPNSSPLHRTAARSTSAFSTISGPSI